MGAKAGGISAALERLAGSAHALTRAGASSHRYKAGTPTARGLPGSRPSRAKLGAVLAVEVWDVHASDGRWWVITNPTNFYPQEVAPTPSMDHALALHIGVTARLLAREHLEAPFDGSPRDFVSKTWRRFEQAAEALNVADEAEDFQAVGMRLRECLISFAQDAADLATVPEESEPPKGSDADTAADAVSHLIQVFSLALIRESRGDPIRCPGCGSYQVTMNYRDDSSEQPGTPYLLCEACGAEAERHELPA